MTGLPYALLVAGNRNTLLTLWPIVDATAPKLVTEVFRGLKRGLAPMRAVARAKRMLIADPARSPPLHWAGFVLYGR